MEPTKVNANHLALLVGGRMSLDEGEEGWVISGCA